jgi:hypothetical protein
MLFPGLLTLALGAYLGAVAMSALAAVTMFQVLEPDKTTAGEIAGVMFVRMDRMTTVLILIGAVGLVGSLLARVYPRGRALVLTGGYLLLALGWGLSVFWINPKVMRMQADGLTEQPTFERLHDAAERSLTLEGVLAGVLVFAAGGGSGRGEAAA